jgi:AraC-like DNA-binding protein
MCGGGPHVFASVRDFLSFLAMEEDLGLRASVDGRVVRHVAGERRPRAHRHAELEVTLVVAGSASYLLGERRYQLMPGTLAWLLPGQDHVLVDESADHELWWAVFRPSLVVRTATTPGARPLLEADPARQFSRRLTLQRARRLGELFADVQAAESLDDALVNAGLCYLLLFAWHAFLQSDDVVDGVDVHPGVERVARLLCANTMAGGLASLARTAALSPSHLSRLFKAQMGVSISRFRNQQRLQRFDRLYGEGQRSTAVAAALRAGFGSYAQFYRVFKRETGRRPSAGRTTPGPDRTSP